MAISDRLTLTGEFWTRAEANFRWFFTIHHIARKGIFRISKVYMNILVIGGTGFISSRIVAMLLHDGHYVTTFNRNNTQPSNPAQIATFSGDRKDLPSFRQHFERARFDVAIDCCAFSDNHGRTGIASLDGVAPHLVVLSSVDVYKAFSTLWGHEGTTLQPTPIQEHAELRTQLYPFRSSTSPVDDAANKDAYEKILVERAYSTAKQSSCTILRLPSVYGPFDPQQRLKMYVRRMADGRPRIYLPESLANWRWSWQYVDEVAKSVSLVAGTPIEASSGEHPRLFNLGEEKVPTFKERLERLAVSMGWNGSVIALEEKLTPAHMRVPGNFNQPLVVTTDRFRSVYGAVASEDERTYLASTAEWQRIQPYDLLEVSQQYASEDRVEAESR